MTEIQGRRVCCNFFKRFVPIAEQNFSIMLINSLSKGKHCDSKTLLSGEKRDKIAVFLAV